MSQQTGPALERAQIETAVRSAAAAPSILNCQPWRFVSQGDLIALHVVPDLAPRVLDPTGREVFLSLGAAVLNLRLALGALGRQPVVQLMPSPYDPGLVATVRVGGPARLSRLEQPLFDAIPARRASRMPFTSEEVPYEDFMHLAEAAASEGGQLDPATGLHRSTVVDLLHEADRTQRDQPELVADVARWTVNPPRPDVGIPTASLGPRPRDPNTYIRDMTLGVAAGGRPSAEFETSGLLAVLLTTGDHPIDWVLGGMALERVWLTATARGIDVGVLSHATEVNELRRLVRDPSSRWQHPQLVLRFGHGDPMPASPRRPLEEVLTFA